MRHRWISLSVLAGVLLIGTAGLYCYTRTAPFDSIAIECLISSDQPISPALYLDYGDGFSEKHRGRLEIYNAQTHYCRFWVAQRPFLRLRIDPHNQPGRYVIQSLHIGDEPAPVDLSSWHIANQMQVLSANRDQLECLASGRDPYWVWDYRFLQTPASPVPGPIGLIVVLGGLSALALGYGIWRGLRLVPLPTAGRLGLCGLIILLALAFGGSPRFLAEGHFVRLGHIGYLIHGGQLTDRLFGHHSGEPIDTPGLLRLHPSITEVSFSEKVAKDMFWSQRLTEGLYPIKIRPQAAFQLMFNAEMEKLPTNQVRLIERGSEVSLVSAH